jgi:hypothetical protein
MMGSEQILNGLVSYLSCKDNNEIVEIASECLKLLAREEKNRQVLYKTKGLVSILTALTGSKNTRVKKNAISAMKRLNKYAQEDTENNSTHSLSSSSNVASKHNITHLHQQQQKRKKRKLRTYALSIAGGMDDNQLAKSIQDRVVQVMGILSLTIDQRKGQVLFSSKKSKKEILRNILPAVIKSIRKAGASATLLGEVGKKCKKSSKVEEEEQEEQDKEQETGYLDDSEYFGGDREGVLSRFASTTLQARLADQRRKEMEMANQKSVVTSAAAVAGNAVLAAASWFGY